MSTVLHPFGVSHSILGQPWRWRGAGACEDLGSDDLVTELLVARGAPRDGLALHREPTLRGFMPDPSIFRDMDRAAARLADAVEAGERVTVFGDYDVDGATSAALTVRLLRQLGLDPAVYIPDRLLEGYGPSGDALGRIAADGTTLCLTVDCGAQAFEALAAAHAAGLDVVVLDHHKCATALPKAHALVNPNRLDEGEGAAHGHLAAVGVCFLLGAALLRTLRGRGFFGDRPEPRLLDLLDLVALGTVADVAQLKGLNRAFVRQGLKVLAGARNIGLSALLKVAGIAGAPTCRDLGFALGPRINAGGRVGCADLGVRLLTTEDEGEAECLAVELDRLNGERRAIEAAVAEAADALLAGADDPVAVVAGTGWHPGVIGIVAGRLKERLGRPTLVIALDEAGLGKGSGRSITGVDLGAAVLAAKDAGLLVAGGGHAMAAGCTVAPGGVEPLRAFLNERLTADVARARADRALMVDAAVAPRGLAPSLVDAFELAGPFGAGWPAPRVAVGPVSVLSVSVVGNGHVRALVAGADGARIKAIAFRAADGALGQALLGCPAGRRLWMAGRAQLDTWGSRPSAELHLDDAAWAD